MQMQTDKIDGDIVIPNDEYERELAQQRLDDELRLADAAVTSLASKAAREGPGDLEAAIEPSGVDRGLTATPLSARGKCVRCDPDCWGSRRHRKKCAHKRRSRKRNRHKSRRRGKWRKKGRRKGGRRRKNRRLQKKWAYQHARRNTTRARQRGSNPITKITTNSIGSSPTSTTGRVVQLPSSAPHHRQKRAATARLDRIWAHGVIPYQIDDEFSAEHKALFKQAMQHWENATCIKFVEREPELHPDWIVFAVRECGCCSFVGRRGNGEQAISIGKNCDKFGIVVHELGHVVGFWHEHTRPDRDHHVEIFTENIMEGQDFNFNKMTGEDVDSRGLPYDYESIMHYARNTFSKNSYLDTILPRVRHGPNMPQIGQRLRLSQGDIAQTMRMYNCSACGETLQMSNGTFSAPPPQLRPNHGHSCEWRITATHGERIVLNISDLDIHSSDGCETDYLEVRDGYWHHSALLGRFCGSGSVPELVVSTGRRLLVTYVVTERSAERQGFTANYTAVCGGELKLREGVLESPNYPDYYRPNQDCVWLITVEEGHQVAFEFTAFEVENHDTCLYDYVEVRNGPTSDSPLVGKYCGYQVPEAITSSGNHLWVRFVSDGSVPKPGFAAHFMTELDECSGPNHGCEHNCVNTRGSFRCSCRIGYELHSDGKRCEEACGGTIEADNGTVTSPSFPDLYPRNKYCIWELIAAPNHRITLNLTHFDLEGSNVSHQECDYDRLEVSSVLPGGKLRPHGTFCGSNIPPAISSETNKLQLTFLTDSSVEKTGFAGVFITDKDECWDDNGGCQHRCINTIGSFMCACDNGFMLHENGKDCKEGGCKHEIDTPSGEVSSPEYPETYPSKKDCVWHFSTTPGHRIRLVFNEFDLEHHQECTYDHVTVYDGDSENSTVLGTFCGAKTPHPVIASRNEMYMTFTSDASVQRKGFIGTHSTVCGGYLFAEHEVQHLYSHAKYGDENYGNRAECTWTIEAPVGYYVRLRFLTFELEHEQDCGYDNVKVVDGFDETAHMPHKYCGNEIPPPIVSTDEVLRVIFKTDDTMNAKGFSASYEIIDAYQRPDLEGSKKH
ncbi:tolloid-like protein 2 [Amphibalanus amphitrite]|uniref:tolloid-like protein 2 n=1 Tax=Amphibalanus amphitrite TaxID=1232801 RepID=UPI001C91C851|nr:tolloid-like protein 2 [Amphibalanus amphitrite]